MHAERARVPAVPEPERGHGKRTDATFDKRVELVVQSQLLLFERLLIPLEARPFIERFVMSVTNAERLLNGQRHGLHSLSGLGESLVKLIGGR